MNEKIKSMMAITTFITLLVFAISAFTMWSFDFEAIQSNERFFIAFLWLIFTALGNAIYLTTYKEAKK